MKLKMRVNLKDGTTCVVVDHGDGWVDDEQVCQVRHLEVRELGQFAQTLWLLGNKPRQTAKGFASDPDMQTDK